MPKSKKILLITLPSEKKCRDWRAPDYYQTTKSARYMPLGLLSLATNLSRSHDVEILDASAKDLTIEQTISEIETRSPDILGISSLTERAYAMREILQRTSVPYKAVGGPHMTYYTEQTLRQGADAVFVGHLADLEFNEAVENLPKGIINCETKIDQIKFPDRNFVDIDYYFPKKFVFFEAQNRLPMFSSIGCPHHCTFCDVQTKKIQRKSPEKVVEEMKYLHSLGSRSIHVLDDNFNVNEPHVHRIMNEMGKQRFSCEWSGRGQARMSEDLAARLSEYDFKRIHVGFEALDDQMLRFFRKPQNTEQIARFCNTMNKHKIDMLGFFIVGTPVETEEYLRRFPKQIKELNIKYPYVQILYPAPNTEYYSQLLKQGIYKKDIWKEFMENPIPDFVIPYPYEKTKLEFLLSYVDDLEKQFMLQK